MASWKLKVHCCRKNLNGLSKGMETFLTARCFQNIKGDTSTFARVKNIFVSLTEKNQMTKTISSKTSALNCINKN